MRTFIAIGGGEMRATDTFVIDSYITSLAKQKNPAQKPMALFMPQASGESKPYCNTFYKTYGSVLKCKPKTILLSGEMSQEEIESRFDKCDLIYIGGGNFLRLMEQLERFNLKKSLINAYNKGKIISGISAGAMCMFEYAISDCYSEETNELALVKGLGIIKGIFCPHAQGRAEFAEKCQNELEIPLYLCEDKSAFVFKNEVCQDKIN